MYLRQLAYNHRMSVKYSQSLDHQLWEGILETR